MPTKKLHRITGIIISVFIVAHLFNHAMAWFGIETHREIMEDFRKIYRNPFVEIILIVCFIFQIYSGIIQFLKLRKQTNLLVSGKLKMYSGLYIAYFLIQHILAVIGQRIYYQFDTNFYFASRVVLEAPAKYYFIPYYFLGVFAFGVHVATIHREKVQKYINLKQANIHAWFIASTFFIVALLILYVLMGGRYEIVIPKIYEVY